MSFGEIVLLLFCVCVCACSGHDWVAFGFSCFLRWLRVRCRCLAGAEGVWVLVLLPDRLSGREGGMGMRKERPDRRERQRRCAWFGGGLRSHGEAFKRDKRLLRQGGDILAWLDVAVLERPTGSMVAIYGIGKVKVIASGVVVLNYNLTVGPDRQT